MTSQNDVKKYRCKDCGDWFKLIEMSSAGSRCRSCHRINRHAYNRRRKPNPVSGRHGTKFIRNQDIVDARAQGKTLKSISREFFISRQRVKQILDYSEKYVDFQNKTNRLFNFIIHHKEIHDGNSPNLKEMRSGAYLFADEVIRSLYFLETMGKIRLVVGWGFGYTIEVVGGIWMMQDSKHNEKEEKEEH